MIKLEHIEVMGFEHAIRGMRNPMNSWDKSDSTSTNLDYTGSSERDKRLEQIFSGTDNYELTEIGKNDLTLMKNLVKAGTDHRKFMRMITIYMDITAPLYWWKEFDTYKVGTVANSCSTMHKIADKVFTIDDFSHEHLLEDGDIEICLGDWVPKYVLDHIVRVLNRQRSRYLETKEKKYWWQMIQLLPSSYNQKRTVMLNYEVLAKMYHARKKHKLDEWVEFCRAIEKLPYSGLIVGSLADWYEEHV